ncbi:hypothetical protein CQW23_29748 [Capsicum baccatum]|uniref:Ubiquitin-like protease family profile domain-containing protein n=1 Tax=Capsicum baccatum TaxID=33114 RepID=A0A2G2VCF0_CAPBA|nr:hypothetical protein CQW23_29748 [Capsicum baccatum]
MSAISSTTCLPVAEVSSTLPLLVVMAMHDPSFLGFCTVSLDFAASSECSSSKCQECKVKHDGVINAINALTASIKEMTSKRGVIPSKRISYPVTPLEIKADKRRSKDTSKASSIIKKIKIVTPVFVLHRCGCHSYCRRANITVDYPSTASKDKKKWSLYSQQQRKVFRNEECLINIIKGFNIPAIFPWHLVDEVYIPINYGDEFHWVLVVVVLKERRIRVYDSISRRRYFGPSSEIQKLAKILPTYLDMSGCWIKRDCGPFVAAYAKYLSDGLQVPNEGLDARLLHKIYAALLWKYGEVKSQKLYVTDVKDPQQPKPNSIALDKEQLVHID